MELLNEWDRKYPEVGAGQVNKVNKNGRRSTKPTACICTGRAESAHPSGM